MIKRNHFPTATAPHLLIFLSNLFNIDKVTLVPNLGKSSLAKVTAKFYICQHVLGKSSSYFSSLSSS